MNIPSRLVGIGELIVEVMLEAKFLVFFIFVLIKEKKRKKSCF